LTDWIYFKSKSEIKKGKKHLLHAFVLQSFSNLIPALRFLANFLTFFLFFETDF